MFKSSTRDIPEPLAVPRHVAIIMDGNGRWAKQRLLPRVAGHRKGVEAVRATVRACIERGVEYLTLFAFSSENWRRPADEVSILMQLFLRALEQEVAKLHDNGIRFKVIGDMSRFDARIRELIAVRRSADRATRGLTLTVAANYGGRWDIAQAAQRILRGRRGLRRRSNLSPEAARTLPGDELRARARPFHPHRRRAAHLQFPAVAARLHRALFHRPAVAGFRRQGAGCGDLVVPAARAPLRPHQRAGAGGEPPMMAKSARSGR